MITCRVLVLEVDYWCLLGHCSEAVMSIFPSSDLYKGDDDDSIDRIYRRICSRRDVTYIRVNFIYGT